MQKLEFTLVVTREDGTTIEASLGYSVVRSIAQTVDDHPSQMMLIDVLARHPSSSVRQEVASRDCLSEERIAALADDPDIEVRRAVRRSAAFCRWATTERLLEMSAGDVDFALQVACDVQCFDAAEIDRLAEGLAQHSDPQVRAALAEGWRTPKRILKKLLKDQDHEVGIIAQRTLDSD